jgi:hypothetical protein
VTQTAYLKVHVLNGLFVLHLNCRNKQNKLNRSADAKWPPPELTQIESKSVRRLRLRDSCVLELQAQMRHADVRTALKAYAHVIPQSQRYSMERIARRSIGTNVPNATRRSL